MNKQKSWREKINDIMENYRLYEEGSGSANWDDKYTKQIVKVVGQAISSERQRLIEEVREKVIGEDEEYMQVIKSNPFLHYVDSDGVVFPKSPQVEIDIQRGVEIVNRLKEKQRKALNKLKGINEKHTTKIPR